MRSQLATFCFLLLGGGFGSSLSGRLGSRLLGGGLLSSWGFWLFRHVNSSLVQSGAIAAETLESCAIQRMIRPLHIARFSALCEMWTVLLLDCFSTIGNCTTCCVIFVRQIQPVGEFSIRSRPIAKVDFCLCYRVFSSLKLPPINLNQLRQQLAKWSSVFL